MDPDQTPIQNKEASFMSDSEDATSPPKKRGKHGSDFDSSEQKRVLDFDIPELKPEKVSKWFRMFEFRFYGSESSEVFQDMLSECEKAIEALIEARDKAKCFFERELADLEEKQPSPTTSDVLRTIRYHQRAASDSIIEAREMLPSVKVDVSNYLIYRESVLLTRIRKRGSYFDYLEKLANIPGVDKMIKYLRCGVANSELIEERSGLTPMDMCVLVRTLEKKNKINFVIEEYKEDKEQFGPSEMKNVLDEIKVPMKNLCILRNASKKAEDDLEKQRAVYEPEIDCHVMHLVGCLESAGVRLGIIREQLNLLCRKNVIVNGYPKMFQREWCAACHPYMD